jgi:HlyD family secretion protein
MLVFAAGVVLLCCGIAGYRYWKAKQTADASAQTGIRDDFSDNKTMNMQEQQVSMVSGTGTTYYGTSEQKFQMSFSDEDGDSVWLQVEEVYVSEGDEVTEGTPVYKLTDESVEKVREILNDAYDSARMAYENANYTYNKGVLNAQCTYLKSMGLSDTALESYEMQVDQLNSNVQQAQTTLEEAAGILETNPVLLQDLYVKADAYEELLESQQEKLDTLKLQLVVKKKELEESQEVYTAAKVDYDYLSKNSTQDTSATSGNASKLKAAEEAYMQAKSIYDAASDAVKQTESAISQCEQDIKTYQKSKEDVDKKLQQYYDEYVDADENLDSYAQQYEELSTKLSAEIAKAENSYEENVYTYTNAQQYYELQLEGLEDKRQDSIDTYEKTKEALEEFENFCSDGIVRAQQDGKIVRISCFEGMPLTNGTIVTYYDYDNLSVQVSVSQSDIMKLNVGDTAMVTTTSGQAQATVQSISTTASSQGASRVYYTVTVSIPSDSGITSGTAATVYFGSMNMEQNRNGGRNEENR